jgi:hypothetical protein
MLQELRSQISASIREHEEEGYKKGSRTFFVLLTPSLSGIREWFTDRFPVSDEERSRLYPWVYSDGDIKKFKDELREALQKSFDADLIQDLTLKGFQILSTINQVVVIADVSAEGTEDKIRSCIEEINSSLVEMIPKGAFYLTGIFIRKNKSVDSCSEKKEEKHGKDLLSRGKGKNNAAEVGEKFSSRSFHRVFIIDNTNALGTCLASDRDLYCLVGHLLYFMTRYPIATDDPNNYVEWLKRNRSDDGYISGFSAFSIVLPLDRIAEAVAVYRGGGILKASLLEDKGLNFEQGYLNNFLHKNKISGMDEVKKSFSEFPGYPMREPIDELPDFDKMKEQDYLETMDALDASLPGLAKENGAMMEKISRVTLKDWKFALETDLETIIARERGGLKLATVFLESLKSHLRGIIPDQTLPAVYQDPALVLSGLRNIIAVKPSNEAVYGRSAVLSIALLAAAASYPFVALTKAISLAFSPVVGSFIGFFVIHSSNERLRRELVTFENLIRGKWKALMNSERERNAKKTLTGLLDMVEKLEAEIDEAIARAEEIVDYFQNRHTPPEVEDFALWKYLIRDRSALLEYKDKYPVDTDRVVDDYIKKDVPTYLWRRLAPKGSPEPNSWEYHLLEEAALCALPYFREIMKIDIKSFLEKDRSNAESVKRAMIQGGQPFINIRPEASPPMSYSVLEMGGNDTGIIASGLKNGLLQQFNFVDDMDTDVHYRISFFGFHEGIKTEDVMAG